MAGCKAFLYLGLLVPIVGIERSEILLSIRLCSEWKANLYKEWASNQYWFAS